MTDQPNDKNVPRITAMMTCHNRRELTERCLRSLLHGQKEQDVALRVIVVDDGSTDGTADMIRDTFPSVEVIRADGDLYWAGGMALAEMVAVTDPPDYLLWVNDDVELRSTALFDLLALCREQDDAVIVVGPTLWRGSNEWSYGGCTLSDPRRPTSLRFTFPDGDGQPKAVDAFNGNAVLIPWAVHQAIGPIDGAFRHAYADIDYGLRAKAQGIRALMAPAAVGECDGHPALQPWLDTSKPAWQRLRSIPTRKGIPLDAHWRYVSKHGGSRAVPYFVASYLSAALKVVDPRRDPERERERTSV